MSKEDDNKAIVGRWFGELLGQRATILPSSTNSRRTGMRLQYSLQEPRRGRDEIKAFIAGFREAFTDPTFGAWPILSPRETTSSGVGKAAAPHTGPAFSDFLAGSLPAATGRKMHFTGTTVLKVQDGKPSSTRTGPDDGVKALTTRVDPRGLTAAILDPVRRRRPALLRPGSQLREARGPVSRTCAIADQSILIG